MAKSKKEYGKSVYIQPHLLEQIEAFAKANNLPLAKAVNELLSMQLRQNKAKGQKPITVQDLNKVFQRVEMTNIMLEETLPALMAATVAAEKEILTDARLNNQAGNYRKKIEETFEELKSYL